MASAKVSECYCRMCYANHNGRVFGEDCPKCGYNDSKYPKPYKSTKGEDGL